MKALLPESGLVFGLREQMSPNSVCAGPCPEEHFSILGVLEIPAIWGVWELLSLKSVVIPISVWRGWLGPRHPETSPDQTSCHVFTLSAEAPLVSLSPSPLFKPAGTVRAL